MQLSELGEKPADIVERVGPRRVPRKLHLLPGCQLGEDLLLQLTCPHLDFLDLAPDLPRQARALLEFFEFAFQLDDGALEIEHRGFPGLFFPVWHGRFVILFRILDGSKRSVKESETGRQVARQDVGVWGRRCPNLGWLAPKPGPLASGIG